MKINAGDTPNPMRMDLNPTRETPQASAPVATRSAAPVSPPSGDSIALSATNSLVQQALGAGVDARAARIQQLRTQVESGQYHVDAAAVSNSLIEAHLAGD
jgi:flagellar biosynthesis anti-sigma factor FlgM